MKVHRQLFTVSLLLPASLIFAACSPADSTGQPGDPSDGDAVEIAPEGTGVSSATITEAPVGFDNLGNGFCNNATRNTNPAALAFTQADMDEARDTFGEVEDAGDGIGPVFNNISCVSCHGNPFRSDGSGSQISELRAGHLNGNTFVDHPGGSLINDRAVDPSIQERVLAGNEVRTFRITLSIQGDGFVEAIDSNTIAAIASNQPAGQRGTVIQVAVLEAAGNNRVGRFGWKNQNSSLLSFAADAYLNEMGITNRLLDTENTSNGVVVQGGPFDGKGDPAGVGEDDANDIDQFTLLMRCLKAPPRGPITAAVTRGQGVFNAIGCATCHVASINTAPAGAVINGGAFTVPPGLGDKTIHPFGDYLLHGIGTGDGIVQNGGQGTRNQVRTAPLWGVRARNRLMHDGLSFTITDAIARHNGQANGSRNAFQNNLNGGQQSDLLAFVLSL